jgi:hypothetical protein
MFSFLYNDKTNTLAEKRITIVHPKPEDFPPSARGYSTNNVYSGFPPIMSDGRALIGAWQPESLENDALLRDAGIQSNWDYRQYLQKNAESVVRRNFIESANDFGFYERGVFAKATEQGAFEPSQANASTKPAVYKSVFEPEHSYGYAPSDLKQSYLSREQLAAKQQSMVITQEELLKVMASNR